MKLFAAPIILWAVLIVQRLRPEAALAHPVRRRVPPSILEKPMRHAATICRSAAAALALLLAGHASLAAQAPEKRPVQFPTGGSGVTITGTIKGSQTIDYTLRAQAGQVMAVTFKPSNASAYFNVMPPGSTGEAIFIGSTSGNEYSGDLAASGEYTIRVYLMRNAARRNETADYSLEVTVTARK